MIDKQKYLFFVHVKVLIVEFIIKHKIKNRNAQKKRSKALVYKKTTRSTSLKKYKYTSIKTIVVY